MSYSLLVKKLDPRAISPTVANPGEDLGYDLYALEDTALRAGQITKVRTGIAAAAFYVREVIVKRGNSDVEVARYETGKRTRMGLIIKDRSSMASKGIFTHGGVIDAGYNGEIAVIMSYLKPVTLPEFSYTFPYYIKAGDKIAQMVPVQVLTGDVTVTDGDLPTSDRGEAGFGSTGR